MNFAVLATYLVQAVAGMATAFLMLRFWGTHRREYLRLWGWSWAALVGHQIAAGFGFQLSTAISDPAHPARVSLSILGVTFAAWQAILLVSGTRIITRDVRGDWRGVRWLLLGSAVFAVTAVLATTNIAHPEWRRLVRIGLPILISSSGFLVMAGFLLKYSSSISGIATRMLAFTALAYALGQILSLWAFVASLTSPPAFLPLAEYTALLNFLMQNLLALGMIVWLLEIERDRAASASAALGQSESRLQRLFDSVRLVAWEFDPKQKRFLFVSPQAQQILGYSIEEWTQPHFWFEHLHPDDRERAQAFSREHVGRGVDHEFEYRMLHKDGRVLWFRDLTTVVMRDGRVDRLHGVLVDVSARRMAEEEQAQTEARYRAVVEDQTELICRFRGDGTITFVNDNYCQYFGHSREQLVGSSIFSLMSEANARRQREVMASLTREQPSAFMELCSPGPGGAIRWRQWIDRAIFDERGAIREFQAVGRDITQQKNAEHALIQSEQRFRSLAEHSNVGIWQINPEGFTLFANPAMCRMLDVEPPEAMLGRSFHEFFTPESLEFVKEQLQQRMGGAVASYEADLVSMKGRRVRVIIAGSPVRGADGRIESVIGTFTDITERQKAELALRESEARLRSVIDNAPSVAIQGYDIHGCVLFWNRAAETMFGWSETEAVGKTLNQLMLDEEATRGFVQSLIDLDRGGAPVTMADTPFVRRDGTRGWCYSAVFRIPGGTTPTFICMDVDITKRKQVEQALERSSGLQRLLLSELDHRVRNNLASLAALIDISSRDSRSVKEFAASIRTRVQAMSVVHALLSREHWQSVDLRQLLLTLAPVGSPQSIAIDGPPVSIVPRQATALGMVLQELLANSHKYGSLSRPGGTVSVAWTSPAGDGNDNGSGRRLRLRWREHGGPPIVEPVSQGVGTGLLHGLVRTELGGEAVLTFPTTGAAHELTLTLDDPDQIDRSQRNGDDALNSY